MTEEQIKNFCKGTVEHGDNPLTREEKELLKKAIDESKTFGDLLAVVMAVLIK